MDERRKNLLSQLGAFETEQVLPNGMHLTETAYLKAGLRVIKQTWPPDAQRRLIIDVDQKPQDSLLQKLMIPVYGPEVCFLNLSDNSVTTISFPDNDPYKVKVSLRWAEEHEQLTGSSDDNAQVSILYDEQGIKSAEIQVGASKTEPLPEMPWEEVLPIFVNYLKTQPDEELKQIGLSCKTAYVHYIKEDFSEETHPAIQAAQVFATLCIDAVLKKIPPYDRENVSGIFNEYGLYYGLIWRLLSHRKAVSKRTDLTENPHTWLNITIDDLLDDFLNREVMVLYATDNKEFKQLVEITQLTDEEIQFQKTEVESGELGPQRKLLGEEESVQYGQAIVFGPTTILLEKTDESTTLQITVDKKGHGKSWQAEVPLHAPTSEIITIGKNPEEDFRKLRVMVPTRLVAI